MLLLLKNDNTKKRWIRSLVERRDHNVMMPDRYYIYIMVYLYYHVFVIIKNVLIFLLQ